MRHGKCRASFDLPLLATDLPNLVPSTSTQRETTLLVHSLKPRTRNSFDEGPVTLCSLSTTVFAGDIQFDRPRTAGKRHRFGSLQVSIQLPARYRRPLFTPMSLTNVGTMLNTDTGSRSSNEREFA